MLRFWSKRTRIRAALLVAVMYAACVLAPHAAMAFGDSEHAAHCLTDSDEAVVGHVHSGGATHTHADGTVHAHHDSSTAKQDSHDSGKIHSSSSCCGLFSMTAIGNAVDTSLAIPFPAVTHYVILTATLCGGGPDCLYRPPNV